VLSSQRQSEILRALKERGSYSITDLATDLDVSTETIRRNVKPLVERGLIVKFHGGIMLPERIDEAPYRRRMQINHEAKQAVARLIASDIQDGDAIILDNGTTTAYVADALAGHSRLVVITNSADIACRLAPRGGNRVFMAGGELNSDDIATFGAPAVAFLRQFQVRYAILSVAGISGRGELVNFHLYEAEFANAAIEQADECWVVADQTKFGREAPVKVCDLKQVDVVYTDAKPSNDFRRRCAQAGVRIKIAAGE